MSGAKCSGSGRPVALVSHIAPTVEPQRDLAQPPSSERATATRDAGLWNRLNNVRSSRELAPAWRTHGELAVVPYPFYGTRWL